MSRPIPVEIIPSHVHLSTAHQEALFGAAFATTVMQPLSQSGQYVCAETVDVSGRLKRSLALHILGPARRDTQVEVTPTEAQLLGIEADVARSGDQRRAADCTLRGPQGSVQAPGSVIVPQPHLHCSDTEAQELRIRNGSTVTIDIVGDKPSTLTEVVVRVHPTYRLRLHVHPDIARTYWFTGVIHGRIRETAL